MKRLMSETGTTGEAGSASSISGAVDSSAFDSHLASCIKLTSASHYKPTWELVSGGPPLLPFLCCLRYVIWRPFHMQ